LAAHYYTAKIWDIFVLQSKVEISIFCLKSMDSSYAGVRNQEKDAIDFP